MTKKQAKDIILAEMQWCRENPANMPEDYRRGFIEGLKQAMRLILAAPINK